MSAESTGYERAAGTGFERALEGLRATGASVPIRELVSRLAEHGTDEGKILAEYESLAEATQDRAARYLVSLIMEDERRHHRLLVEMATAMAWETLDPAAMGTPPLGWALDPELVAATRRLREYEERDRKELERLRKELKPFEETTLWALIVDLLLLDTQKHATILRFIERHAADSK